MATTTQTVTTIANTSKKEELEERADQAAVPYRGLVFPLFLTTLSFQESSTLNATSVSGSHKHQTFGSDLFFSPFLAATLSTFSESEDLVSSRVIATLVVCTQQFSRAAGII
ncbi:hypothetical protein FNYG_04923 [Fusarium nygamai]|uniref:Uncharacterized protein n=1 Tax=Gibberella nygamai TaxID=42673 RepID=A0A2K0WHZ0_GIBNY|nr:hypothetical protein FNYG_04923 [Fusarium nygamai]